MATVYKTVLRHEHFSVNAMAFIPQNPRPQLAIFTHGYTSHKAAILTWATRLEQSRVPTVIFDLPGHYLGSYQELNSFENFTSHAHELFKLAYDWLKGFADEEDTLILGGHSLGALLSIKALELFDHKNILSIAVGFGLNPNQKTHIFDTPLYEKTLVLRNQLVSEHLDKDKIFAWIKEQKEHLNINGQRIHLLCGEDDMVVGTGGVEHLAQILKDNNLSIEKPNRLPHHQPDLASSHINSFLKKELKW